MPKLKKKIYRVRHINPDFFLKGHSAKTFWPITIKSLGNDLFAHKKFCTIEDMYSKLAVHMFNKEDLKCTDSLP